ncbi:uncharacterized protein ASPGLDRAFT_1057616 [Aspergillus glaucus CBS 516.65]|uniref:Uncharacterized protein n=1 Tax=Aspergillus glaucus CBS 516.65 TaxID=1160497 RepID=A0A1L9V619_ASPGL|nr:hypothetical protein ASPGLDRAFT_1057616 [Aspergillus glaucus CBS 516.65]OJJ79356.1 hypothetical protein ASPGLDRAFT_1057616 [Aspergillus glaucus CBS 516.65]
MSNRMNITFTLPKGNWHETQHRNRRGGITKKYRTPHKLNFTFNLGEKAQIHRKGQGCRYHLRHNHRRQTQNFRGGKHPRNSERWRQHNKRTQQQQAQPQPQGIPSQFYETVSPSDFQSWERHNRLSPMTMSQDYTWQQSAPNTPSQQQQVETQCLLQPPEQRQSQRVPSQFYETMNPREFRSWERLNRLNQATQNHHVWQSPALINSSQQQQYDTQHLLDQEIEKMRQNHQS